MRRPKKFKIKRQKNISPNGSLPAKKRRSHKKATTSNLLSGDSKLIILFRNLKKRLFLARGYFNSSIFPHIFRIYSARVWRFVLLSIFLAGLSGILTINIMTFQNPLRQFTDRVLVDYKNPDTHLRLAEAFLENNDLARAKQELLVGSSLAPHNEKLLQKLELVEMLIDKPSDIASEIRKWEDVIAEKVDYRDGYFRLAVLYYQLFQNEKAKKYASKALELDPNFEPAKQLMRLF